MEKEKNDNLPVLVFGVILSFLTYVFVLHELKGLLTDYNGHTYVYLPMFTKDTWVKGWMMVPYCMWHLTTLFFNKILLIPLESSAAYSACLYTLFAYFVMYWMIRKVTTALGHTGSSVRTGFIAFGMCILQPFYFHWLDAGGRFLGPYSMNPIHNPTYICLRGFSLICFCLVCDIWGRQKNENYHGIFFPVENGLKRYYICLSIVLFFSTVAKPTFAEMFIPAVALIMLGEWIARLMRKDGTAKPYFRHCLITFVCAVPSLLYILIQYLAYFTWGGSYGMESSSVCITKWLEVWHMYTENVGLSIVLGMAFPLFMLLINGAYFIKSDSGRLSLVSYVIAFLEAALLGEPGKLSHGDFLWPLMSAMLLMFVTSLIRLLVLERTEADTKGRRLLLAFAWFLFCIHVLYGLLYIWDMMFYN